MNYPEKFPYCVEANPDYHMVSPTKCDHCKKKPRAGCDKFILTFPDDPQFAEWVPKSEGVDGIFCSIKCALECYWPIYVKWRLTGDRVIGEDGTDKEAEARYYDDKQAYEDYVYHQIKDQDVS